MRLILIILFLVGSQRLFSQEVIATAGSTLINTTGSMSFTIGESITNTLINGDKTITQGFHQTNVSVSIVSELKELDFTISAFPNPTDDILTISISSEDFTGLQYRLYDANGRLLSQKELESRTTPVIVKQFSSGIYILKVTDGQKELKTFKIIKQ